MRINYIINDWQESYQEHKYNNHSCVFNVGFSVANRVSKIGDYEIKPKSLLSNFKVTY